MPDSPTESRPHVRPSIPGNSPTTPKASKVLRVAPQLKDPSQPILPPHSGPDKERPQGRIMLKEGHLPIPSQCWAKAKGKPCWGLYLPSPKWTLPSPPSMEASIANSHMFEEPLLRDPDKEVVSDLAAEFKAPVIKKVLDLQRE